jgi:hypothetical protein
MAFLASLRNRHKLEQFNTIDDAVALIAKSKKILVLTGAGVSVCFSQRLIIEPQRTTWSLNVRLLVEFRTSARRRVCMRD